MSEGILGGIREAPARARLMVSTICMWVGRALAPPVMRPVMDTILNSMAGIPGQVEIGRDGGIIIAPWFISPHGKLIALAQKEACVSAAAKVRAEFLGNLADATKKAPPHDL